MLFWNDILKKIINSFPVKNCKVNYFSLLGNLNFKIIRKFGIICYDDLYACQNQSNPYDATAF